MADTRLPDAATSSTDLKAQGRPLAVRRRGRARSARATRRSPAPVPLRGERRRAVRPCETITAKVDCALLPHRGRPAVRAQHARQARCSTATRTRPTCKECHGTPRRPGQAASPISPTFPTNVPQLCARAATARARRRPCATRAPQHEIIEHYTESIHGKGLLKSGLTVTATCTSCHTAHGVLPRTDPASSVNRANVPDDLRPLPPRHPGAVREEHPPRRCSGKTDKELPVCNDCHTAHTIRRADADGFKLDDHAEVRPLPRGDREDLLRHLPRQGHRSSATPRRRSATTATARTTSCRSPTRARTCRRENVVATCQKCHPGATRRFAGYLTHATHHDPKKYPWLFWTFWGMTGAPGRHLRHRRRPHAALAAAGVPDAAGAAGGGGSRGARGARCAGAPA